MKNKKYNKNIIIKNNNNKKINITNKKNIFESYLPKSVIIYLYILAGIIIFIIGINFGKWGGFDRMVPSVINFLRDNIFGDNFVLTAEKSFFSVKDYIKKNSSIIAQLNHQSDFHDNNKYTLSPQVVNLLETYMEDYTKFNPKDYDALTSFFTNFCPDLKPLQQNTMKNEGHWEKTCISQETFKPLYAKTFLRTDINRPYAQVFIYKYDLDRLNLEFIPSKEDSKRKYIDGKLTDCQKEKGMWIFSGGFQYKHGRYGFKYNGEILQPPKNGLATLLFYRNGAYKIVEWKDEYLKDENIVTFRQNELPLIINKKENTEAQKFWGLTPKNVDPIYTYRSGLGLTENNELIFAVGKDISPKTLAIGMIQAGVVDGMHLDMNYWNVHLIGIKRDGNKKIKTINENSMLSYYNDMYLNGSKRDYFIITKKD